MSREKMALLLLAALVAISLWNIGKAQNLCREIFAELQQVENFSLDSEPDKAEQAMKKALNTWLDAEKYTHIFIRHPEIDSCTDLFYDALEALHSGDNDSTAISLDKLRHHLESIAGMERLSIGNIF